MRTSHLTLDETIRCEEENDGGEEKEKKEKRERRRRRREKLHLLSSFSGDRTVGFYRSKMESSSLRKELQVETGIGEFRQTPRGKGLSPTWFNSRLKSIQMVLMFWGRKWPCIPIPKIWD